MNETPSVFVVDDDADVRDSLCWLIESVGWRVEAFGTAQEMLQRAKATLSGCLVADLRLPGMSGLDMHDELLRRGTDLPTIVITGHGDVSAAVRAMKAGVVDFIEKPFSDMVLLDRIREAMSIDEKLRSDRGKLDEIRRRMERLTRRETQVLDAVVAGKLNKQIASDLGLSHKTIEVHRAHVMEKMEAASLAELVRMYVAVQETSVPQTV